MAHFLPTLSLFLAFAGGVGTGLAGEARRDPPREDAPVVAGGFEASLDILGVKPGMPCGQAIEIANRHYRDPSALVASRERSAAKGIRTAVLSNPQGDPNGHRDRLFLWCSGVFGGNQVYRLKRELSYPSPPQPVLRDLVGSAQEKWAAPSIQRIGARRYTARYLFSPEGKLVGDDRIWIGAYTLPTIPGYREDDVGVPYVLRRSMTCDFDEFTLDALVDVCGYAAVLTMTLRFQEEIRFGTRVAGELFPFTGSVDHAAIDQVEIDMHDLVRSRALSRIDSEGAGTLPKALPRPGIEF